MVFEALGSTRCTNGEGSVADDAAGRALSWVLERQGDDHGWATESSKAVIAVNLANSTALSGVERELTSKQLQINFLVDMWGFQKDEKNWGCGPRPSNMTENGTTTTRKPYYICSRRDYPLTTGRIAEYVLAFVSLCFDVRSFHGRDMTAILQHHPGVMDYESAFVVLATCAAGAPVRRRSYSKLMTVAHDPNDLHGTDTLALSVLALRCVAETTSRSVDRHLSGPIAALVTRQEADGGFGNFHSTLLAVQALRLEREQGWNESAAVAYLLSHQQEDGSFGNLFDTTQVLPVLLGRTLLNVTTTDCHRDGGERGGAEVTEDPPTVPPPTTTAAPPTLINFTLWLWVGPDVNKTFSQALTIPQNTSLFDAMKLAAERDSNFEFSATVWPNGHYIHTIGGVHEQKVGYMFWLLYRLKASPNVESKPVNTQLSATGVDDVFPEEGEHILFWYKKI
ncbi:uncharacterized protein CG3556-like isoform X1 [Amphibalanus amphitrite]|uniref:uncharacterized protein CG3556-like isoform X1 n=2 Tax=Amphibalanus amphitrite TaxID=1232801 RepID=UPI001C9173C4|nr:uncharacterized protein CG3556-like isoform X1 [Amphibalanus amphitrite]